MSRKWEGGRERLLNSEECRMIAKLLRRDADRIQDGEFVCYLSAKGLLWSGVGGST